MPVERMRRMVFQISSRMMGARPSVASSRISRRGLVTERAADGQHLLLAARKLVAAVGQPLGEAREQLEHARDASRRLSSRARCRSAMARFSATLRLAKMPRPSGT